MGSDDSIKAKIRLLIKKKNLKANEVTQMYFFEQLLRRLEQSPYQENFILKGGLLIASLLGIENRTTMDMDTSVKNLQVTEGEIMRVMQDILAIDLEDGIHYVIESISSIRTADEYENFRLHVRADLGRIRNPLSIDITTGDAITPRDVEFGYPSLFDNTTINLRAYPLETVLAEKFETIIRRNIATTRMRDFYDIYALLRLYEETLDWLVLRRAIFRTSANRNSLDALKEYAEIIEDIEQDTVLPQIWDRYLSSNPYLGEISFKDTVLTIRTLADKVSLGDEVSSDFVF